MNFRNLFALICLGLAACATTGPGSTDTAANTDSMELHEPTIAAEAMIVKNNVPAGAKESGLVDDDTLICKKEKVVGSHIPRMVCLSAKDRDNLQNISQGYMNNSKRTPQPSPPEG